MSTTTPIQLPISLSSLSITQTNSNDKQYDLSSLSSLSITDVPSSLLEENQPCLNDSFASFPKKPISNDTIHTALPSHPFYEQPKIIGTGSPSSQAPARQLSHHACINDIPTDFVITHYADRVMIIITQTGKLSSWIQATVDSQVKLATRDYSVLLKRLLGFVVC